ncbi:heavy metal translocating P-type ATPase [Saccharibacillus sp. CPCC 101409]|uniref:heavy metal translocating P-type ATPase n=1 Tax=Saccharibacillus sp. CPCC 101409 TaxID=3058041 RepID=UPI0026723DC8|nr:heavy metal translocating P-type ATPase [Saccharibacillus sp. CPCC 101409]MDO3412183.1 heavy metal translocating P-type ATPase [Saccharibacillus sp. CPCC 101409]
MGTAAGTVKREWVLDGLDCANCALKIENSVQKMEGVSACSLNFVNKTLTFEADTEQGDEVASKAAGTIKKLEPHVQIRVKGTREAVDSEGRVVVSAAVQADHARASDAHEHGDREDHGHAGHDHAGHDHAGHSHAHGGGLDKKLIARLAVGAVLTAAGMLAPLNGPAELALFLIAYLLVGGDVALQAAKNIARGQVFDEYFLMSAATIGAFAIGQYPEGVAVMLFYQVGELFQSLAVNRSRKSITSLLNIRPDYANLKSGEETRRVKPDSVEVGQTILVRPGEKVPLDGKVTDGSSMVDTSALTGESVPRGVKAGDEVLGGFINKNGVLTVEVTRAFGESSVAKILELVENASGRKAPTENFISKFARGYTPVVVITALLLAVVPPLAIDGAQFSDWIYRALIFLVISCPCALVVSIPLGFFGGIGAASRQGVLVKGGNYLEALNGVKIVVFDKTGTLTKGSFKVTDVRPAEGFGREQLLETAAYAELHSGHPIADSIREAYGVALSEPRVNDYEEISGHGIRARIDGRTVLAGNAKLMTAEGIAFGEESDVGTVVHIAVDGRYAGRIVIADEVKEDSAEAIRALKRLGIRRTVMLTGDSQIVGEAVGRQLGLDEVHAGLLPEHKVEQIERLDRDKAPKEKILFVGDGINDTPVLARADIGVAMGGLGSDAAIEAADVVIMTDEPSKLVTAIGIAKRTRRIVWQNIWFALGVKAVFLILGAFGIATMWEAVFSDVGVTVIAVLNAMRVLRSEPKLPAGKQTPSAAQN